MFCNNSSKVLHENFLEPRNVFHADETGVHTVQAPNKITAAKGKKRIRSITSSERGTLVTVCVTINATVHSVPPMFVSLRKKFHDPFFFSWWTCSLYRDRDGCGWIEREEFLIICKAC